MKTLIGIGLSVCLATSAGAQGLDNNPHGAQPLLVMPVTWQGGPQPPSTATITSVLQAADTWERDTSYGDLWLDPLIRPVEMIDAAAGCSTGLMADAADAAAIAAGIDLAHYTRRMYVSGDNGCWQGVGTIGGVPSRTWFAGSFDLLHVTHELGHNWGLYHAHRMTCPTSTISLTACTTYTYGDYYDVMGNGGGATPGQFQAAGKARIGWLPPLLTTDVSGTFTIDAYEPPSSGLKALQVGPYAFEYRVNDAWPGVIVHFLDGVQFYEIEGVPFGANGGWLIVPGRTFRDPALGLTVGVLTMTATAATLQVTFGPPPPPTATLTLTTNKPSYRGTETAYLTAQVLRDGAGVAGVPVAFTANVAWSASSITNGSGVATASRRFGRNDPGITFTATAVVDGQTLTASVTVGHSR